MFLLKRLAMPRLFVLIIAAKWLTLCFSAISLAVDPLQDQSSRLAEQYIANVRPLMQQFCLNCHSTAMQEGDLDLERFATTSEMRRDTKAWLGVVEMLDNGEMPPKESKQPTPQQRQQLRDWVKRFLDSEALANAGDPGPTVLRRLNNAEYRYTLRDLTGVDLDPTREFPSDSAAGEGFTNAGNALSMSPALLSKYFDAGKKIASHAVLLPTGFRFSEFNTQRDWTDEALAKIRDFYRQRVDVVELGNGTPVVLNLYRHCQIGPAGQLPFEKYFAATLVERAAIYAGVKTIAKAATENGLNASYFALLWESLNAIEPSLLLDSLRARWREGKAEDAAKLSADLAAEVAAWQKGLWRYNPVSMKGRKGNPQYWQEPINPLAVQHEFRVPIPAVGEGKEAQDFVVSLVVTDCGDGNEHDYVVWDRPRLVAKDQPDIFLRDIPEIKEIAPETYGKHLDGKPIDVASLCVRAPSILTVTLPGKIAAGRTLVAMASISPDSAGEACVQPDVVPGVAAMRSGLIPAATTVTVSDVVDVYPDRLTVSYQRPVLVAEKSARRKQFEMAMEAHRQLFPNSLCYPQVVPSDETLTLNQFHREDALLERYLLDESAKLEIDRLWEELRFISQEPYKLAAVLDSLVEMAANGQPQGGDFAAAYEPFHQHAEQFRKHLVETEPKQIEALIEFAARAYRRPLEEQETEELRSLYRQLRSEQMTHEVAFRLTLAKIFVASPFLYRIFICLAAVLLINDCFFQVIPILTQPRRGSRLSSSL